MTGLYNALYDLNTALEAAGIETGNVALILDRENYELARDAVDAECFHNREDWQFGGAFYYAGLIFVDASSLASPKH